MQHAQVTAAVPTSSWTADGRQPRLKFQNFDASGIRKQKRAEINETATAKPSASLEPENIVVQLAAAGILDALDTDENVALKIVDVDPSVSNPISS